ncbi:helix-turn-helix transcriptional regulator [Methyloversatilis universalis]|uniref:helix-turn-helix transcriptional regulator n=1 Tax=Methyloversatilis universalis TaxID=378211 RepID=UPI0012FB2A05|nr:helix-turn-helix transcriptional regulator [Methyloversatilis universalis]
MNSSRKMRASRPTSGAAKSKTKLMVSMPVGVSAKIRDSIAKKLTNKAYRDHYARNIVIHGLAHQIRENRELRGWTQDFFAKKMGGGVRQTTVSRLEDPSYGKYSVSTLFKVASAFDVALSMRFVSFSRFLMENSSKTPEALFAKSFDDDDVAAPCAYVVVYQEQQIGLDSDDAYALNTVPHQGDGRAKEWLAIRHTPSNENEFSNALFFGGVVDRLERED